MGQSPCYCGKKTGAISTDEERDEAASGTAGISSEASGPENIAIPFSYDELVTATDNFSSESFIREGASGRVFKGTFETTGQDVTVQLLNPEGKKTEREFLEEVQMLSNLRHPNLINLIGYCNAGNHRLLVSEFVPSESNLESRLHARTPEMQPLDWTARMKIAAGVAKGLHFLHNEAFPPVFYRDLKSSNVLLGDSFEPKLSNVRPPEGDHQSHASTSQASTSQASTSQASTSQASTSQASTSVKDTCGYFAPEYVKDRTLKAKSDVYSFGVLLFELITGQKSFDESRETGKAFLVDWVRLGLKDWKLDDVTDPVLKGKCSEPSLNKAVKLALHCTREEYQLRPPMGEVVKNMDSVVSDLKDPGEERRPPEGEGEPSNEADENRDVPQASRRLFGRRRR